MSPCLNSGVKRCKGTGEGTAFGAAGRGAFAKARQAYEKQEEAWREGQAALLAASLAEGQPCPVCGSTDHPHKASFVGETLSREQLDEWRNQLQAAEKAFYEAKAEAAAAVQREAGTVTAGGADRRHACRRRFGVQTTTVASNRSRTIAQARYGSQ